MGFEQSPAEVESNLPELTMEEIGIIDKGPEDPDVKALLAEKGIELGQDVPILLDGQKEILCTREEDWGTLLDEVEEVE